MSRDGHWTPNPNWHNISVKSWDIYRFFIAESSYGFGGYPPPFTDGFRKNVFDTIPDWVELEKQIVQIVPTAAVLSFALGQARQTEGAAGQ